MPSTSSSASQHSEVLLQRRKLLARVVRICERAGVSGSSSTPSRPWLTTLDLLDLPEDGAGRVVVTDPDQPEGMDLGQVLRCALAKRTHTFTAIVGYFGHGGSGSESLSDPAGLVAGELGDHADQDVDDSEERARFCLLYGALVTVHSHRAFRAWYLVCRWRHGPGGEAAVAWRRAVLAGLRSCTPDTIGAFATSLFVDETSPLRCPLLSEAAEEVLPPELRGYLREWRTQAHGMGDPIAAVLFVYLLQRRAEVRFGRTRGADVAPMRVFHPKLYVIERERDTIVVAGSGNWSAPALSAANKDGANVEMGVVFRSSGHAWSNPGQGSTGHDLAATGVAMFHHPRAQVLASWTNPAHPTLAEAQLALELQIPHRPIARELDVETPPEVLEAAVDLDATTLQLRLAIQRLIEQSLRLAPAKARTVAAMLEAANDMWGSKRPSGYQIDGAVRLLQILETSRGAMLTDEPGLGKTLTAQLAVAALIKDRIARRIELATDLPVRVTIIAPARVLGATKRGEPTQWFLYAREIRAAVQRLLADDPHFVTHAEKWTTDTYLSILPLSVTSFGRRLTDLRDEVLDDLEHVAASEIVVLDEAHNFRNGTSRATRVLRFCLSLPAFGEVGWRPKPGTAQEKLPQPWSSRDGRKILLLTATPFNNHIGDIHAQVGHFAKAQTWEGLRKALTTRRKGRSKAAAAQVGLDDALAQAIIGRVELDHGLGDPYWRSPDQRAHLEALLALCSRDTSELGAHFESSRALDLNEESVTRQGEKGIDATARATTDTGPVYQWGGADFSSELDTLFRVVADALEEENSATSEAAEIEASARSKIDFFLSAFVVQRSRHQIIADLSRTEAGRVEVKRMFRDPGEPRRPRRLMNPDAASEQNSLDRAFLDALYQVFRPASEVDEDTPRITLEAYRIRYMRGFSIDQRSAGRVTNFIGFQAMTLIKRLQSSPYAFMRTLARGFVLASLTELAIIEELLDRQGRVTGEDYMSLLRRSVAEVKRAQSKAAASQAQQQSFFHRVADGLVLAKKRVMEATFGADDEQNASAVVHLLRGETGAEHSKAAVNLSLSSPTFFRTLCSLDGAQLATQKTRREAFLGAVEAGEALLESGFRAGDGSWLSVLLRNVSHLFETPNAQAGVVYDACQGLQLLYGDADGKGLAVNVYKGLQDHQGHDMASLIRAITRPSHRTDQITEWVAHRLKDDARLTGLVAFMLLHLHVAGKRHDQVAGDRVLIFTEYGDTLEYIRAILTALSVLGKRALNRDIRQFLPMLRSAVQALALESGERGEVVADGVVTPFSRDDVTGFMSLGDPELHQLLASIGTDIAVISAKHEGGRRIGDVHLEEAAAEEAEDETADSESLQTGAGKIGGAPILDAFSPFYQVDLPPLTDGAGKLDSVRKRLAAALEQPVRVLLATEVLAEGVNLQQSGILIHYDLPWNPTRLIQRNGRVDRRINALVENPTSLERYLEGLGLADPKAAAASYVIPLKVFHFTVPPIEATALDAEVAKERAQRVRAVLAAKLDSIRRILGLSSWPVVLDQATATAVLDGSLEYETPSLVRRERLLQRVRQLEASTTAARDAGVTATSGTITLKISRDDLGHLARTVVGEPADWSRLRALVLTTWSPRYPRSTPLRSAHEWYATQETRRSGNPHDLGGMMPILLFAENALTWIPHTYTGNARSYKKTLLPVSWNKADYVFLRPVDLTPTTNLVIPEAMSSPAALFDVVLDWLAELALGRGEVFVGRIHIDPPSDRPWAWLGEELARQPPTMPEIEPGDVGAALRRPHANLIQGTPAAAAETFAADKLESFNLVITP